MVFDDFLGGPWGNLGGSLDTLEEPWESFGGPWGSLVGPWESLGAPWGVLGGPWAVLGGSWGVLGGPWGVLGTLQAFFLALPGRPAGWAGSLIWSLDQILGGISYATLPR